MVLCWQGAVVVRQRAHAARVQLGAGVAAAGQSLGMGARCFRQRMDQVHMRIDMRCLAWAPPSCSLFAVEAW